MLPFLHSLANSIQSTPLSLADVSESLLEAICANSPSSRTTAVRQSKRVPKTSKTHLSFGNRESIEERALDARFCPNKTE